MMRTTFQQVHGRLELFRLLPDGSEQLVTRCDNRVVDTGSDILAKALGGDLHVSGLYLRYTNAVGVIPVTTIPATRTADYYHSLGANEGIVRVAALAQPSYSSSDDSVYVNNNVVFVGISDGTTIGAAIIDGTSRFFQAGLIYLDPDDYEDDILFSAAFFLSGGVVVPVTKIANAQVGVRWTVTFTTPAA